MFLCGGLFWESVVAVREFYELDCDRGRGCNRGLSLVWVLIMHRMSGSVGEPRGIIMTMHQKVNVLIYLIYAQKGQV